MLKSFFEQLANYYHLENDLSNMVVALCNSHLHFKEKFIHFFFPGIELNNIESVSREVPDDNNLGSRVDIFISMSNDLRPYIIEVKIGDRNHHFGQYEEAYGVSKDRFGYITNYNCIEGKQLGYDVKSWEEFYDHLSHEENKDEIIIGFLAYLKNVCGIIKYRKPMNIAGLNAIKCFDDTCRKIIEEQCDIALTNYYRTFIYTDSIQICCFFRYSEDNEKDGALYFGLWFKEKPAITLGINSREWLSEKILEEKDSIFARSVYAKAAYKEFYWNKSDVWFDLRDDKMEAFMNASTYEEQVDILRGFFHEVLKNLKPLFA